MCSTCRKPKNTKATAKSDGFCNMGSNGFEPLKAKSQQIYSLSPLAARATPHGTR